jgi:hypothetical protein
MDPSTPTVQDVQNKSTQAVNDDKTQVVSSQPMQPAQTPPQQKTPVTISSGNKEGEGQSTMIVAESPDADEEDEVIAAPQETKTQVVQQGGGVNTQEEEVAEIAPVIPEFSASSEVKEIVEKSPDQEKPDLPQIVQDAGMKHSDPGVTHSGLGVIDVEENQFGVKKLPITYHQAAVEEKVTKLHDSKHWLMGTVMYIWRKLNPKFGKESGEMKNGASDTLPQIQIEKGEVEVQTSTKPQG